MNPKKMILAAVAGSLFTTNAHAIVDISITPTAPVTVASELIIDPAGTTVASVDHRTDVQSSLGYAMSSGEVRHVRFECSPHVRFTPTSNVDYLEAGAVSALATTGAINGGGSNAISFSITANAAGVGDQVSDKLLVHGGKILTAAIPATCSYGLYDQPSQAATGGAAGRLASFSGPFLQFESGYVFNATEQNTATADVEADPAYTRFLSGSGTTTTIARLARLQFGARAGEQLRRNGQDIVLADMFAAGTYILVDGDFTVARNTDGSYGGDALSRVFLAAAADCSGATTPASTVTATEATFRVGSTPNANQYLCISAAGTIDIQTARYTATLVAVEANPTTYRVVNGGPLRAGAVQRNGTELQAPLVQLPGNGWLSRMVLTNTGSVPRAYSVGVQREEGSAGTTANLTGTVPANGTVVVDLNSLLTGFSSGLPRATLNVTVSGPSPQIQGLYQIVNANSSTISNHVMVRPGTN